MRMKNYLLIYDSKKIKFSGSIDEITEVNIYPDTIIETFDSIGELLKREEEVKNEIINNTENPSKYYYRLLGISDEIETIARALYTNIKHIDKVDGAQDEFNDDLRKIQYIIKVKLIKYCLGDDIDD